MRSAIVNTAEQDNLTSDVDGTTKVRDVNIVGTGQVDFDPAVKGSRGSRPGEHVVRCGSVWFRPGAEQHGAAEQLDR